MSRREDEADAFLRPSGRPLLWFVEAVAAVLFAANVVVVSHSVIRRYVLNSPVEWADDVASALLVGMSVFGAAAALARGENVGIEFFVNGLPAGPRRFIGAGSALTVLAVTTAMAVYSLRLAIATSGQTSGSGLPLNPSFYEMGIASLCMVAFAVQRIIKFSIAEILVAVGVACFVFGVWALWRQIAPGTMPGAIAIMFAIFALCLLGGVPIGFVLAFSTLLFIWYQGTLPGVLFAQQMARGIDNFVLLAIPFFILVGYMMEANGMSRGLIELIRRVVCPRRAGLDVVMVLSMLFFSCGSRSEMADVAAAGSVRLPA